MVLDGEIAVPDSRGVTHFDALNEALRLRRADQLAYFAFDLLHLDGHDLRTCAIEDRKAPLRDTVGTSRAPSPVQPVPAGLVKFGLAGKDLWQRLDRLRSGPSTRAWSGVS